MKTEQSISIVIPCFNEAKSLNIDEYQVFFKTNPNVSFCFVDDGSSDNTLQLLQKLESNQIHLINLENNSGKAEAVRQGMLYCMKQCHSDYLAFFDADLSTPLTQIELLQNAITNDLNVEMAFGSRILTLGNRIDRKRSRFIIGRTIATFISNTLKIKVYDTQCGAKLFDKKLASQIFQKPFISRWLFDVELIFRVLDLYGRKEGVKKLKEVPLNIWEEKGNSKIKWTYGLKMWVDLYKIKRAYKHV